MAAIRSGTLAPVDDAPAPELTPVVAIQRGRPARREVRYLAPLSVFVAVLVAWTLVSTQVLDERRRFLLPPPHTVVRVGLLDADHLTELLEGLWSTIHVALVGFALAAVIGLVLAIVMSQARWVEHSIYPYAVVLQTIPILAVVPLLGFWFGFEFRSRVIVCVLVSLFPIITNTLFGLQSVGDDLHELFSLHRSGRLQRLVHLQLPAALPAIVTGFKISAGLSVIGAIIADFFFRQGDPGIGRLIDVYRQRLATEQLLSALLLSSLVGLILFWICSFAGQAVERGRAARPR